MGSVEVGEKASAGAVVGVEAEALARVEDMAGVDMAVEVEEELEIWVRREEEDRGVRRQI